jgi:cold shock CspA family protein
MSFPARGRKDSSQGPQRAWYGVDSYSRLNSRANNRDLASIARTHALRQTSLGRAIRRPPRAYREAPATTRLNGDPNVDEQTEAAVQSGTIARLMLDKGFGFFRDQRGTEHFFHRGSVRGAVFELLREGQRVEFTPEQSQKRTRAGSMRLVDE